MVMTKLVINRGGNGVKEKPGQGAGGGARADGGTPAGWVLREQTPRFGSVGCKVFPGDPQPGKPVLEQRETLRVGAGRAGRDVSWGLPVTCAEVGSWGSCWSHPPAVLDYEPQEGTGDLPSLG